MPGDMEDTKPHAQPYILIARNLSSTSITIHIVKQIIMVPTVAMYQYTSLHMHASCVLCVPCSGLLFTTSSVGGPCSSCSGDCNSGPISSTGMLSVAPPSSEEWFSCSPSTCCGNGKVLGALHGLGGRQMLVLVNPGQLSM